VYRYERSGTMHGLFRVRGFTQDDAHIFCLPDQIADEILGVLDLTEDILSQFGFTDFEVNLSTKPEKSVGGPEIWERAEGALVEALAKKGWDYEVDEGGGAFYGPKIDIKITDAIGRKWQCSTVQLDFNLPERFDLTYADAENVKQRPIMIHRAIFGSLERFFGILTENYAGAFPLWMAPTQVRLLPVTDAVTPYVEETARLMREAGVRVDITTNERLAKLVRNAEKAKVPVMCVVGEQEAADGTLTVRTYADGDQGAFSRDDGHQARRGRQRGEKGAVLRRLKNIHQIRTRRSRRKTRGASIEIAVLVIAAQHEVPAALPQVGLVHHLGGFLVRASPRIRLGVVAVVVDHVLRREHEPEVLGGEVVRPP
jgi:threonyl-tRNA synthetase